LLTAFLHIMVIYLEDSPVSGEFGVLLTCPREAVGLGDGLKNLEQLLKSEGDPCR